MATIDSNGVLFYQDSDNFTPPASLNLAQSNLSSLISNSPRFRRVANLTARSALVTSIGLANITPDNPLLVWRADAATGRQLEYTTNGSTWRTLADKEYYDAQAAAQDTGWQSVALASGYTGTAGVRKQGNLVYVRWSCSTSFAANAAALPLFTVPVGYRPLTDVAAALGGTALYPWTGRITTAGAVQVRNNHTLAQSAMVGTATYLVD